MRARGQALRNSIEPLGIGHAQADTLTALHPSLDVAPKPVRFLSARPLHVVKALGIATICSILRVGSLGTSQSDQKLQET